MNVGQLERKTQDRVIELFHKKLQYAYLGNWENRPGNSNIEEEIVRKYLSQKGYSEILINKALDKLRITANNYNESLYTNNKNVYELLRYGIKVKADIGENYETVELIDWKHPLKNDFAIAEEVTISGNHDKRPDIVLYVNGIALGVLELKRSIVSIGEGIRQSITNQQKEFIQSFFSTIQFVFAGNDTEGLRYGTIGTEEKYFLKWKEEGEVENLLDKYLLKLCDKKQFLEIIYNFTLFDGGRKKLPRHHQYFGIKAAQEHMRRREGGIIWHTQGSGKSMVMVWLAKWILENNPNARVVILTDRDELDKQIERVFNDSGESMVRTTSGKDLMSQLGQAKPRLLCSLVHKFGRRDVDNFDEFIEELKRCPTNTVGEIFVFVVFDFNVKPRLSSGMGNAILIACSIYEACRYFELFQSTELKGRCAVITSYNPSTRDITTEDTGANTETEKEYIYNIYKTLLGEKSTEKYEDEAKAKFIKEPANMKLLVVVDKLLVGFDAPPCSYLYIDKSMQDHGLFQAICRVNRLDSDDKEFGYIVDYKDLFRKVENAVAVYTSELDYDNFQKEDVDVLLKDRLEKGRERLDDALEEIALLCEPVAPPKDSLAYIRYFCGKSENEDDLKANEVKRIFLYKQAVALIRAYANIAGEMEEAGYSDKEIEGIKKQLNFYLNLREEIRKASGETLDLKTYEADMRHLIDNFIQADESKRIDPFGDQTLLDIIVKSGIADAINSLPQGIRSNKEAIAETIENNVRRKIIKEHLIDPAYFEEMSKLLSEIIKERKANATSYEEYLKRIAELAKRVNNLTRDDLPAHIQTPAQRALYNNLGKNEALSLATDEAIKRVKKADWRGNPPKEQEIKAEIYKILKDVNEVERIFPIIKQQNEY
ncbi:DEAD/DEAH box helicase family protein [bacterium]|nr:DEAD/DEAH box helicase family protein [bacterium]